MTLEATVLIPTHNHAGLLRNAAQSALAQTVQELEVLIVGDGVDEPTREVARGLCDQDDRVRFFDNPKGPRHGEIHRHRALQQAVGRIVCYLADDDLWLVEHVETMAGLLLDADFCHALPLAIRPDGSVDSWVGHLSVEQSWTNVINHQNFIPFSCGAHTMTLYQRLPHGWQTTPDGIHTDVYMWAQILALPDTQARTSDRVTVLTFPSPWRTHMSAEERARELDEWAEAVQSPNTELGLSRAMLWHMARERAATSEVLDGLREANRSGQREALTLREKLRHTEQALSDSMETHHLVETKLNQLAEGLAETVRQRDEAQSIADETLQDLEEARIAIRTAHWSLNWMQRSLTWRLRGILLSAPGIGWAIRKVGEARSRRGGS